MYIRTPNVRRNVAHLESSPSNIPSLLAEPAIAGLEFRVNANSTSGGYRRVELGGMDGLSLAGLSMGIWYV